MNKNLLSINQCKPGMKLSEDVVNIYGAKIAPKNSVLNDSIIAKFKLNDIEYLCIYSDIDFPDGKNSKKTFIRTYNESVLKIKYFMKDIGKGKNIELDVVCALGNHLLDIAKYTNTFDIFRYLNKIREVDDYTYHHSINVALIALIIGKWLNFSEEKLRYLTYSGLLHDIGKVRIPKEILNKPGKLTEVEYEEIKKHTTYGYQIIKTAGSLPECVAIGSLTHHERINGSGYPMGLKNDDIPEFGRVIAVADIYDAMTSNRVYHNAENPFRVFDMLQNRSFDLIDTDILLTFLKRMANYYIGDKVILSDGCIAQIVFINQRDIACPLVKIVDKVIDLSLEREISIQSLVHD